MKHDNIFEITNNYRIDFLNVLKDGNKHYSAELINYETLNKNFNFKYYRWLHPLQGSWETFAIFTDDILKNLKKIIDNKIVLDIGAQTGLMSVAYAQFASKVISFEPNPATYEILEKNSILHKNIIPYNFACSTIDGPLEFHYSDEGLCNGGFATNCKRGVGVTGHYIPVDVYAVNIIEFMNIYHKEDIKNISLIKIDAEGHDKEIIKNLFDLIIEIKPTIITEIYAGLMTSEIEELFNILLKLNYDIYHIGKINDGLSDMNKCRKIESINDFIVGDHGDLLCVPRK